MAFQKKSNQILLVTAFFLFLDKITPITSDGISCFKCFASQPGHEETDLLCSQFDGSSKFQVYCPFSTLCRKTTIYYKLRKSIITTVERDCAPQKSTIRIYSEVNNNWHDKEEIVKTAYEEGCYIGEDRGSPAGPPEYCFCSFHLCNSSQSIKTMNIFYILLLTVILLFTRSL